MVGCKRKACRGKVWHASNICFFPHTHESHTVCNIACWAAHSKWDGPDMSFLCLIGFSPRVLEMVSGPFPLLPKLYYLYLTPPKKKDLHLVRESVLFHALGWYMYLNKLILCVFFSISTLWTLLLLRSFCRKVLSVKWAFKL